MKHISEKELTLYYYSEAGDPSRIQEHLNTCEVCRCEHEKLTRDLSALDAYAVPERDESYGSAVWRRVRTRMAADAAPHRALFRWWRIAWAQAGWVVALLLAGFLLGRHWPADEQQELRAMRELLTLSLLQQQSASERLAGVSWSRRFEQPDDKIVDALVQTLNYDSDVNVRLAAVDALARFSGQGTVRDRLLGSLDRQSSPLVQISLIDLLIEIGDKRSAEVLRRLAADEKANQYVRERAEAGLRQLS